VNAIAARGDEMVDDGGAVADGAAVLDDPGEFAGRAAPRVVLDDHRVRELGHLKVRDEFEAERRERRQAPRRSR